MCKKPLLTSQPEEITTGLQGDALHRKLSVDYTSQELWKSVAAMGGF